MVFHGDFEYRRRSQRVFVDRATNDVILRLHQTDIVRVRPNGDVILSTGGWATHKTQASMNDVLQLFDMYVDCASASPPQGRWQVTDSDGTIHPYNNDETNYIITIRSKGGDDKKRAQWLAEAYEVPYTPTAAAAAQGPRVASAPRTATVMHAPPAPAQPRAANGVAAASAVAAAARVPGVGGSWANIAASRTVPDATATHAARMTGPGASSGRVTTGPGAAAAAYRPANPPGFAAAHSAVPAGAAAHNGVATHQQQQQQQPARQQPAAAAQQAPKQPSQPVGVQLEQHMQRLGIQDDEDDSALCVVCMEEPRSIVLVPCGHMALCKDCCNTIIVQQGSTCPMCCQPVEYHVEVDHT